jgi:hypothetical protein
MVIRDILLPDRDPVRAGDVDDPSGGVLDGAPDVRWWPGSRRTPQPARALP